MNSLYSLPSFVIINTWSILPHPFYHHYYLEAKPRYHVVFSHEEYGKYVSHEWPRSCVCVPVLCQAFTQTPFYDVFQMSM